ncbi:MAG: hydantoinase B/oxoprolinase family protein, partial [Alphaproteobacteria bacterium]|nr:hydantoinase B/oxoprolinase family protein [Alphaproteobacteria bacterium]
FSGQGERFAHRPWGIFGGEPGACGRFLLRKADGTTSPLPPKPSSMPVTSDQALVVETPGAGGYGEPSRRLASDVEGDRRQGKFSAAYLEQNYRR